MQYHYEVNTPEKDLLLPYIYQYIHFSSSNEKLLQKNLWPSANASLIFNFKKTKLNDKLSPVAVVVGLHDKIHTIQPDENDIDTIIIHCSPVVFSLFNSTKSSSLTNNSIDAKDIFGEAINSLSIALQLNKNTKERQNMLDTFFIGLLTSITEQTSCFTKLARTIQSDPEYKIILGSEISYRHLSRMFKQIIGVNIQTYRRLARFELAKQLLINETNASLTGVGYQSGYYDQAHFAREFKKLSGLTAKYFGPLCSV
ncbi:helix-turn-helix domain-containing protein [Flavobacterium sp. JAS]|uniref:helix-turn-helix domain-containing protein n=1 Tax=Flavobacterium sp. JAS TaxID=2897329 RepID=UPI001E3A37EA|nr:helix-turn-helix domain-containing protein [Flavobacterium sp. JAS]MCD0470354.1 helix-turn-helix domain-containing protein [Flavobacterium sp. JAS]